MSTTKGRNLGLRLDMDDTKDLEDFEAATGVEATTLARNALRACLAYWKQHGRISFPLRLVESTADEPQSPPAEKKVMTDSAPPTPPSELESSRLRRRLAAAAKGSSSTQ